MKLQKSSAGRNGISTYKNYFIGLITQLLTDSLAG